MQEKNEHFLVGICLGAALTAFISTLMFLNHMIMVHGGI